jgi:hypothetical protein
MTVEEKRKKLSLMCDSYCPLCTDNGECPLYEHRDIDCGDIDTTDDVEHINRLYELAFGETDMVNEPPHYTQGNIQCIDAMESAFGKEAVATWSKLNAFKYIWRAVHKNGMEDIDKAIWYLTKYKELKSNERTEAV